METTADNSGYIRCYPRIYQRQKNFVLELELEFYTPACIDGEDDGIVKEWLYYDFSYNLYEPARDLGYETPEWVVDCLIGDVLDYFEGEPFCNELEKDLESWKQSMIEDVCSYSYFE